MDFPANPVDGQVYLNYVYDSVKGAWRASNTYVDTMPAGSIIPWPAATPPPNWLLCDGSAVSRTTYAALFSVIGVLYGNGNGSTTFNLPDLRGRTIVGRDPVDSDFVTLGQSGGAKTHTLTEAQMPNHRHIVDWHNHSQYVTANSGGPAIRRDFTSDGSSWSYPQGQATDGSQPGTSYVGSGQAHNNLQPYEVLNYIIKTTFGTTPEQSQAYDILTTYNARLTQAEGRIDAIRSGYYIRQVFSEIDTRDISFTNSWTNIWTLTNRTGFKAGSKVKMYIEIPLRSYDYSWGGAYIEPQVTFNNSTWYSLGSSGFDGNVMYESAASIATYTRMLLVDPQLAGITGDFDFRVRFYVRSYSGTTRWNGDHDINNRSGTANLLTDTQNHNQFYARVQLEELATGQG